ncbi:MAG TPA: XisI protein [Chthonomonadaceae bacterium]|nr:XisI protein [Chthonomonadaceae bacterium]
MAAIEHNAEIIERVLCELVRVYAKPEKFRTLMAFDQKHGQFLLLDEGWEGHRRIYIVWAHIELRDGKLWIHEDGTEEGIANLLVAAGIPPDRIVLAFHAPSLRSATEFAAA